jgi:hypothetical protein
MYHQPNPIRTAERLRDRPPAADPNAAVRLALSRVRKVLTAWLPNMPFEPDCLRATLAAPLADADLESERLFALGWLHWLAGADVEAELLLNEAVLVAQRDGNPDALAVAAYWRGRVRLLLEHAGALAEFEQILRTLKGSPQATAWFVDLLWRAGRVDRAEQVWKSVRGNKRVVACDEGALLEARSLLRRGENAAAERLLRDARPGSGVVAVERMLLLAWIAVAQKQPDKAGPLLADAAHGPYRTAAVDRWSDLLHRRGTADSSLSETASSSDECPPALHALWVGCDAWLAGQLDQARTAFGQARSIPAALPFARYALACLGKDDHAAVLASQPGAFVAVRCRLWSVVERFRQRRAPPVEYLDVLQHAAAAGIQEPVAQHFRQLAQVLQRQPIASELQALVASPAEESCRRNLFRAALEAAVRHLPGPAARELLVHWSLIDWITVHPELRTALGRQLLRLMLTRLDHADPALNIVRRLLPDEPLLGEAFLVADKPECLPQSSTQAGLPARKLWLAAKKRSQEVDAGWTDQLRTMRSQPRWCGLAQALLLHDAARRGDVETALTLLEHIDSWRDFRPGPPHFVLRSLVSLAAAQPGHPGWRRSLPRWLQVWELASLGAEAHTLIGLAGLTATPVSRSEAPAGTLPWSWFLHLAARALARDDAVEALACTRRALALDPELVSVADAATVRDAVPELERRARAQVLAEAVRASPADEPIPAALLVDAIDLLAALPDAAGFLEAADRSDPATLARELAAVAERSELPPRLLHHLALIEQRCALALQHSAAPGCAEQSWRRAWHLWLRFLAVGGVGPAGPLLLDWLLSVQRCRINDLLARNAIDQARGHWSLVQELPTRAAGLNTALSQDMSGRVERFREDLATDYLLTTREAMRYGDIPEGFHADYEKGLTYLRRLLSLDRENVRLLTALVEVCDEWFLDIYHAGTPAQMAEQVERATPFALQLARLVEGRPGDLAALAALADFYKFRGLMADDLTQKVALYREALRFNPANENVRNLLAELEKDTV